MTSSGAIESSGPADGRRRLARDASAVLVVAGFILLAATVWDGAARTPAGGVLGAFSGPQSTAPPGPTSPSGGGSGRGPTPAPTRAVDRARAGPVAGSATRGGSADRLAVLEPCAGTPRCFVYTIRAGDNVWSIARWFGVPYATVLRLNPWVRTEGIRRGDRLVLPPPTR